ncbi:MAG TPA: hypothetical protein VIW48_07710 [Nitrospiraceae bacterium]
MEAATNHLNRCASSWDDLTVVLKEAEKELTVIVEGTHEGLARGRTQHLLERLKGVACGF